eukprot:scaffold40424_cov21-Tisochrysis_lutea.AAC.1
MVSLSPRGSACCVEQQRHGWGGAFRSEMSLDDIIKLNSAKSRPAAPKPKPGPSAKSNVKNSKPKLGGPARAPLKLLPGATAKPSQARQAPKNLVTAQALATKRAPIGVTGRSRRPSVERFSPAPDQKVSTSPDSVTGRLAFACERAPLFPPSRDVATLSSKHAYCSFVCVWGCLWGCVSMPTLIHLLHMSGISLCNLQLRRCLELLLWQAHGNPWSELIPNESGLNSNWTQDAKKWG